ncbi:hypothetical protein [Paraburkholderia sp. UCT31]|uniref:hypothetical protein n=1 Tax=Paraburkholderia sp. UCT31 TaxID=2615209 RepID=UPI00165634DA|nr:hypothetical protein [Paraburkholderia sp. UCT31]
MQLDYAVELARGASHIASTLAVPSLHAAITETVDSFVKTHGKADLQPFLKQLADDIGHRRKPDAAIAVRHYAQFGSLPPIPQPPAKRRRAKAAPVVAAVHKRNLPATPTGRKNVSGGEIAQTVERVVEYG